MLLLPLLALTAVQGTDGEQSMFHWKVHSSLLLSAEVYQSTLYKKNKMNVSVLAYTVHNIIYFKKELNIIFHYWHVFFSQLTEYMCIYCRRCAPC